MAHPLIVQFRSELRNLSARADRLVRDQMAATGYQHVAVVKIP